VKYKDIPKGGKPVPGNMHIRYKGVWDMQDFYESCANYLRERKFKFYEEKAEQFEDGPYGKGGKIYWRAEQNVDDWVTVNINIAIHLYDAFDFEVKDRQGRRKTLTQGKISIFLKISDNWDAAGEWNQKPFYAALKDFYIKYIVRKRREFGYSPRYRYELAALYRFMLRKLKMETQMAGFAPHMSTHKRGP